MNTTDWLLFLIVVLQSGILFWLWRRIDMIESERRVEASTFDHLQVEKAIVQAKKTFIHDHIDHCLEDTATTPKSIRAFKAISKYL